MYENKEGLYIFFFGLGFLMGYLLSLKALDRVYKSVMKKAIDEIHKQYNKALKRNECKEDN